MMNVEQTIISQYGTSPVLRGIIDSFNSGVDLSVDLDNFYDSVWNIFTAAGFGLDIWGEIVGVSRQLKLTSDQEVFGFKQGSPDFGTFKEAPFRSGSSTGFYLLADNTYRRLILAKALANISNCAIPSLNRILRTLFIGRGKCYVLELASMSIQYTFEFKLTPEESAVIVQSGVIPNPTGVSWSVRQIF